MKKIIFKFLGILTFILTAQSGGSVFAISGTSLGMLSSCNPSSLDLDACADTCFQGGGVGTGSNGPCYNLCEPNLIASILGNPDSPYSINQFCLLCVNSNNPYLPDYIYPGYDVMDLCTSVDGGAGLSNPGVSTDPLDPVDFGKGGDEGGDEGGEDPCISNPNDPSCEPTDPCDTDPQGDVCQCQICTQEAPLPPTNINASAVTISQVTATFTPPVIGTLYAARVVRVSDDFVLYQTQTSGSGNTVTVNLPMSLVEGQPVRLELQSTKQCGTCGGGNQQFSAWGASNVFTYTSPEPEVEAPTSVTINTASQVCAGATMNFHATVNGGTSPFTYAWFKNSSNVGPNAADYSFTAAASDNNAMLQVNVSNSAGNAVSNIVTLNVNAAPSLSAQPSSQTVLQGASVTFSASVSQGSSLTYQWKKNGTNISGATSSSYTIASAQTSDAGSYSVQVTNACGSITSNSGVLDVQFAPSISSQPDANLIVNQGQTINLSVSAGGNPAPSYQWRKDGTNIPGANSANLIIANAQGSNAGSYTVVVTNSAGSITSNTSTVDVIVPPSSVTINTPTPVCAGGAVNFHATVNGGTSPLTYAWFKNSASAGLNSADYNFTAALSDNNASVQVNVSNSAGNVSSNTAIVTVYTTPAITSQPASVNATEGNNVTFSVIATSGAALTYQWRKNGTAIGGATAASYTITNVQTSDAGSYSVQVTNTCGNVVSNSATLSVGAAVCNAPAVPQLLTPQTGQVNVSLTPTLSWSAVGNQNCPVTYALRLGFSPICANNMQITDGFTNTNTFYNVPSTFSLLPLQQYHWCVEAKNTTNSNTSGFSATSSFTTRPSDVPQPNDLYTDPAAQTAQQASGQTVIKLGAYNGEENSIGHFYEVIPGQPDREVGSTLIGSDALGHFSVFVDVTQLDMTSGARTYVAKIERPVGPGQSVFGPKSASVTYYFDASLTLAAPQISKLSNDANDIGKVKFKAVPGAESYKLWRRVGLETCDSQTSTCYLQVKPFALQTASSGTVNMNGETYVVLDNSQNLPALLPNEGISYFVTAHNATSTSKRSNAVSFNDIKAPERRQGNPEIFSTIPLVTGRDVIGFLCNIEGDGYFFGENNPDMVTQVKYKKRNGAPTCSPSGGSAFSYADAQTVVYHFDSLLSGTYQEYQQFNCILAAEIGDLEPSESYCMNLCLGDGSQFEQNCFTVGQTTNSDTTSPTFDGLSSVVALSNGTSVQATWNLAQEDQNTSEVIQYEVAYTKELDSSGAPIFKDDTPVKIVNGGEHSTTIGGLETGEIYCFRVSALDTVPNRNTPEGRDLCAQLFDNRPTASQLHVEETSEETEFLKKIKFKVFDRETGMPEHRIQVVSIEYRLDGSQKESDWVKIESKHLTNARMDDLPSSNSINSSPTVDIEWSTLAYFTGEHAVELRLYLKDSYGNESKPVLSDADIFFKGMSQNSNFRSTSFGGCSIGGNETSANPWTNLTAFAGVLLALWALRRSRHELLKQKRDN